MCLGIPGKVIEIYDENGLKMGKIDYSGTINKICLEYVPEIEPGQYTIVHAGFGISIIDEVEANKTLKVLEELADAAAAEGLDIYGNPLNSGKEL
jgi:hydrogenase expression/formation protein HypC